MAHTRPLLSTDPIPEGGFYWEIDKDEEKRLSASLGVDFHSLNIAGTVVDKPKAPCTGCGKLSGLDDFVATALGDGIHSQDFIVDALTADTMKLSPPHRVRCSSCGEYYKDLIIWFAPELDWRRRRE